MTLVSLDHLTLFELTPPELVSVASAARFTHVGLRLNPAAPPGERAFPMLGDSPMRRATLTRMRDSGVAVLDFGVFRLRQGVDLAAFEPVLETAAVLGAVEAVVNGDERDPQVLADLLFQLCELGSPYGVRMNLEPTPWTGIPTVGAALSVLRACGHPGARLMIDTIHVARSGGTPGELAVVPAALIDYVQVCDANGPCPADHATMIHQARNERAFPGEGDLDLVGLLSAVPEGVPWSVEAPVRSLASRFGCLERAERARRTTASLVAAVAARREAARRAKAG